MFRNRPKCRKHRDDAIEREKITRLEQAEEELVDLQDRAHKAVSRIRERQQRNHFAESIRMSIRGVTS